MTTEEGDVLEAICNTPTNVLIEYAYVCLPTGHSREEIRRRFKRAKLIRMCFEFYLEGELKVFCKAEAVKTEAVKILRGYSGVCPNCREEKEFLASDGRTGTIHEKCPGCGHYYVRAHRNKKLDRPKKPR